MRANSGSFAKTLPFAIHNIGGIANLTYITRNQRRIIAFDTGPGNALIDMAAERVTNDRMKFDKDGKLAASALQSIDWRTIESLGKHSFFRAPPPKSTGRELFSAAFLRRIPGRGPALVANATALTAHTMAKAHVEFILKKGRVLNGIFAAGGGARNPTLLRLFSREIARLSGEEIPIGVLPDTFAPAQYLEAMAFARLGYEALKGNAVSMAIVTGAVEDAFGAGIFPGENYRRILKRLDLT
ncbi:MAG: anhydro-N-acetylmuramic acid kinase [Deltaproteobacteria bacterium]|nr:anhydro-N-acetylmuramic acid kinase [Deltaproteobacteria bacterium]